MAFLKKKLKALNFNFAFGMFEIYVNSNLKKSCGIDNSTIAYCESQNLTFTEERFNNIDEISPMTSSLLNDDVIVTT